MPVTPGLADRYLQCIDLPLLVGRVLRERGPALRAKGRGILDGDVDSQAAWPWMVSEVSAACAVAGRPGAPAALCHVLP